MMTTQEPIRFRRRIGDSWTILSSHPNGFSLVRATELGYEARLRPRFAKRHTVILGLSVEPAGSHREPVRDIKDAQGARRSR